LDQLRDELAKAVSAEAFEEAAQLRDRIRALEGGH
jgi:protein-arginine kinase activator protein McsA